MRNPTTLGLTAALALACQQSPTPEHPQHAGSKPSSQPDDPEHAKHAGSKPSSQPDDPEHAKHAGSKPSSQPDDPKSAGLRIGDRAPLAERVLADFDGVETSIATVAKDKGVLVIFTCNHCPWVKAWQSRVVATANAFLDQGVGVIAINSNDPRANEVDGPDGMRERAEHQGMRYPYVIDSGSSVARAFGADKTPEVFLFDADQRLVYHGTIDDNAQDPEQVTKTYLKDALTELVAGRPISVPETKALGCGIKFHDAS